MRRTKIVATLGPASLAPETIKQLLAAGVDVFRLNFSHGSRDSHRCNIQNIRLACAETGREAAILQDLCGPKIRVGEMENGAVELAPESEVVVTTRKELGTAARFSTSYRQLPLDARPGARVLLDDGKLELRVLSVTDDNVLCRVVRGGTLKSHKGMNLPGLPLSTPSVTPKDARDLALGLDEEVDFIALSFVRHPDDIRKVRRSLDKRGKGAQLIAKIEKPEAIAHLDEIIAAADGVMVARGDLGVEMELEKVPALQKEIIRRANEADKYVITATQMLESMIESPTPTRAEVSDVANAIADGTDAVMLSGETAAGRYPVEAVKVMDAVARETEAYLERRRPNWDWTSLNPRHPLHDAIGHAALKLSDDLKVKAIAAYSQGGGTALFLSKSRPFAPILAFTNNKEALRRMRMFWGVEPVLNSSVGSKIELRHHTLEYLSARGIAAEGEYFLLVAGSHFGRVGSTNAIEIARFGGAEAE